nr:DUF3231 family protein [Bacillus mesophilus]
MENIRLTSAELSDTYNTYINDSVSFCLFSHFLEVAEDTEVIPLIEEVLTSSKTHIEQLEDLFTKEGIAIPVGFPIEEHLRPNTPRLFHDTFVLEVIMHLSKFGIASYGAAVSMSARADIRKMFIDYTNQAMQLHDKAKELMQSKGILIRPPYITYMKKIEIVQKQSFIAGFFGKRKSLLAVEISHLFTSAVNNEIGKSLLIGFAQTAQDPEIREYFSHGIKMSKSILSDIHETFTESDLPYSMTWDANVTDSTEAVFSDRFMMMLVNTISALGISMYGAALGASMRKDLLLLYGSFISKAGTFAEDGVNLLIEKGWLEQPPQSEDRDDLITKSEK